MTRAEQPTVVSPTSDALAADSRERAVRALLRVPPLKRLWGAQFVGSIGDALALLVLVLMSLQAAVQEGSFGTGYRGAAFAVAAVFGARIIATLLFGAVLLGPLTTLTAPGGPLDRRWLMIGTDGFRLALLVVAPLWIDWMPEQALMMILITVFLVGTAERLWTIAKDGAAPALLPAPPPEGAAVRPLPDHLDALRRLSLRTDFAAIPVAGATLLVATLVGNLLGSGLEWFSLHQAALGSYVAAGLFAASVSTLYFLELPDSRTPRPRSPLEGLRRPTAGNASDRGRTGAVPVIIGASAAVAGAIAAAAAAAALHAGELGGGPVTFALLILGLTGATGVGIRTAGKVLPTLSRRRLLALAVAVTGIALLAMGLVPDTATVVMIAVLAGYAAGVAARTGHVLVDQETEEPRRAGTTEHLQAVVRVLVGCGALAGPLLSAAIGAHRLASGSFVFDHGGAAFALMLIGALLLPVAVIVLAKTDDRSGVPLRRDLREALRGGEPDVAPAKTGFFLALEGGDGAGKSTQVEALAQWIRAKGHEVVVTREPGATPIGKRLRSILLDVSSAGLSHRAEALLYAADRAEHVDSLVRPALERGAIVISDRYIDSSVAYQGAGRDLSPTEIARISRWATSGLVPHLTVLLDVDPETARERFTEAPDRLESEPPEFHARVRAGFLTLAAADPTRYLVVDAGQDPETVSTVVRHRLDQLLPLSEAEIKAQEEARRKAEEEARRKAEEEAARKAEEERLERERQEQLAKLRAEEEERKRRELEEARRREAERQAEEARQRAEEARRKAEEEARRKAEEERAKRVAEEAAREAEQERLRKRAAEEARQRKEAEERRLAKQRAAEEALLRAEEARRRAEAAAAASVPDNEVTVPTPIIDPNDVTQQVPSPTTRPARSDEAETAMLPKFRDPSDDDASPSGSFSSSGYSSPSSPSSPSGGSGRPGAGGAAGAADETAVLPPIRDAQRPGHSGSARDARDAWGARDTGEARSADPVNRVPRGIFRDERPSAGAVAENENERTRELPQIGDPYADDAAPRQPQDHRDGQEHRARRPRPDWAEETPLDDLPTLADELLGNHRDDEGPGTSGRGRRPRR